MASQRVRGGGGNFAKSSNAVAVGLTTLTTANATTATTNRSSSRFYHSTLASSSSSKSQRPSTSKSYRRAIAVMLMVMTVLAITMIGHRNVSSAASSNSSRRNNDDDQSQVTPDMSSSGRSKSRQARKDWNEHGIAKSKSKSSTISIPGVSKASVQAILDARVHLIELHVVTSELRSHVDRITNKRKLDDSNTQLYDGIYGTFCRLDWSLHKNDPSTYPMFRDLLQHSKECRESHRITNVPLRPIVQLARRYDESTSTTKLLNLTAAVFHESRCGSTLTANLLAAVEPSQHRVYSESTPPIQALHQICKEDYSVCSLSTAAQMLQDVVYLMSRSDDVTEERVFFKIQSAGSRNVAVFTKAFPTTPYLFVFREPVQVLMSHLKNGVKMANCLRSRDMPPASVERIATKYGKSQSQQRQQRRLGTANKRTPFANRRMRRKNRRTKDRGDGDDKPRRLNTPAGRLSAEDYCAAHLASITETMLNYLQSSSSSSSSSSTAHGLGRAVHYDTLPDAYYTDIFPPLLGVPSLSSQQLERLQTTAAIYSKNRGGKRVQGTFESDSQHKEEQASDAVRQAAQTFLSPSYQQLLALSRDKNETRQVSS